VGQVTEKDKKESKLTQPAPLRAGHIISSFDCGEEVLNRWLVKLALAAAGERTANTFVCCRGKRVVGYYALATSSIARAQCTSSLRRNAPDPVPAMILARLAIALGEQKQGLGHDLLMDAFRRVLLASKHVAARTLLVHALNQKAADFYKKHGFVPLDLGPDRQGIITMHLTLEKIVAALKAQASIQRLAS
jgi:GNAT superfamily N-acetyltransferase